MPSSLSRLAVFFAAASLLGSAGASTGRTQVPTAPTPAIPIRPVVPVMPAERTIMPSPHKPRIWVVDTKDGLLTIRENDGVLLFAQVIAPSNVVIQLRYVAAQNTILLTFQDEKGKRLYSGAMPAPKPGSLHFDAEVKKGDPTLSPDALRTALRKVNQPIGKVSQGRVQRNGKDYTEFTFGGRLLVEGDNWKVELGKGLLTIMPAPFVPITPSRP